METSLGLMEISVGTHTETVTLVRELGRTSTCVVYIADDHKLGKPCALRVLRAHLAKDDAMRARFVRDARAAAALNHPVLAKPYAIDELPSGQPCCRMEYVEAPTLSEFCKRKGEPLSPRQILEIIGPICEAFDLLHELRIVHRDLNPENVLMVSRKGGVGPKVLDFGVAHADEEQPPRRASVPGTAAYMAPELVKGGIVDRACDVYSLGVMLYWMATGGHLPYEVRDAVMHEHQTSEPPVDPRRHFSGVSDLAANVILTSIHPEPGRRPRAMGALARMFAHCDPEGLAILRSCAPGVLVVGNLDETLRAPGVRSGSRGTQAKDWKYEYGQPLGRGGMAEVVRATLRGEGQFAAARAIKLILPEFAQSPEFVEMFHEEARVAALLEHRNIVRVLEHDRDPQDRLYLAMEFVDGIDLNKLFLSGPIPHAVTIFVLCEVLEALDYIHELPPTSPLASPKEIAARGDAHGLVHRDVSHHNVLISWLLDVKLSDFGIAKLRTSTSAEGSKSIKGKAGYMAPEQAAASNKLDGRSDLWAIGVMLWELLTGQVLFNQDTFAAVLGEVRWGHIPRPIVVRPDVPADLDAITMRLLERDLSKRFPKAREVRAALLACRAAPRDGRAELAHLLAERYPDRARPVQRGRETPLRSRDAAEHSPPPAAPAFALPPPSSVTSTSWELSSTTGNLRGESRAQQAMPRRRWTWATGPLIALATLILLIIAGSVIRRTTGEPSDPPLAGPSSPTSWAGPHRPSPSTNGASGSTLPTATTPPPPLAAIPSTTRRIEAAGTVGARIEALDAMRTDTRQARDTSANPLPRAATSPAGSNIEKPREDAVSLKQPDAATGQRPSMIEASRTAELPRGELAIIVKPWAMVTINGKPAGQTPIHRMLPVGSYRIRLVNDIADKDESVTVTVSRGQTTNIERTWARR